MHEFAFLAAGLGVGVVFGLFGAGGSAFATPILALMGVPAVAAIASPLPAILPASLVGAGRSVRAHRLRPRLAALTVAGGIPGALIGALASQVVSGRLLLLLSAIALAAIGTRVLLPDREQQRARAAARSDLDLLVVAAAFAVGILTGLLANGGGFLLVPLFMIGFGLSAGEATGTSLVVVGILTVPTLIAHWSLGHIDWSVALAFAAGLLPGTALGTRWFEHVPEAAARRAFGLVLVVFAAWFFWREIA